MKKQLLLILGLMFTATIFAAPVSKEAAKKNVLSFLQGKNGNKMYATAGINHAQITAVDYEIAGDAFYVFNFANNGGFVIASSDDRFDPILGYSYEGSFDPENVPVNMKNWLNYYSKQINAVKSLNIETPNVRMTDGAKKPYRHAVPMLLTCKWNQTPPYNNDCPRFPGDSENRPTGCVATAMAQVLYYHKWPQGEIKSIPGYEYKDDPALGGNGSQRRVDKLPAITFDWDNMLDEYGYNSDQASKKAVAALMRYCGQAVNMGYHPWASGAFTFDIARGLRKYLGFDNGARYVEHSGMIEAEWEELIYNEIANNRPVLYSGAAEGGGHQFVCDGYENEYFHFNWGWGGQGDGFFKLTVLDPVQDGVVGGNGMDFSQDQAVVIGVQRPVEGSNIPKESIRMGSMVLTKNHEGNFEKNNLGKVTINLRAILGVNIEANLLTQVGFALCDADDNIIEVLKSDEKWLQPGGYEDWKTLAYPVSLSKTSIEKDGTYYLKGVVKYTNASHYSIMDNSDRVYFEVKVSGQKVTVTPYPIANVTISNVNIKGNVYTQAATSVNATIENLGEDFEGIVYLTQDGKLESGAYDRLFMKKGEKKEVSLRFSPYKEGEHTFGLSVNGRTNSEEFAVNIIKSETVNATLEFNPQLNITSDGNYFDIPVEITNQNKTKEYKSNIIATLYQKANYSYKIISEVVVPVELEANGKTTVKVHFDDLEFNKIFYLGFSNYSYGNLKIYGGTDKNGAPKKTFSKYKTADAVSYYDAAGNMEYKVVAEGETFQIPATACYVNIPKTITGRTFNLSSNPNCIYNVKQGVSTSQFQGGNIVQLDRSLEMNLTDKDNFYSVSPISVEKMNLTINPESSMSTIMLPFNPEQVTVDGKELTRANSVEEFATSDYAILPIVAEEADKVYCEFNSAYQMSTPSVLVVKQELLGKAIVFSANRVMLDLSKDFVGGKYFNIHSSNTNEVFEGIYGFGIKEFSKELHSAKPFSLYLTSVGQSEVEKVSIVYPDGLLDTGIDEIDADMEGKMVSVYTIDGVKVRTVAYGNNMLEGLPSGLYIVNGKKFVK